MQLSLMRAGECSFWSKTFAHIKFFFSLQNLVRNPGIHFLENKGSFFPCVINQHLVLECKLSGRLSCSPSY